MSFLEQLKVLRYYRPFIEAGGGIKEVQRAMAWSVWYAVKWWGEVHSQLGLAAVRTSPFARALYISLRLRGHVREDGSISRAPQRPEYPTNRYSMEFVELHEAFDRLGAAEVAAGRASGEALEMLYSAMLSQGWYGVLRQTFLELVQVSAYPTVAEPHVKEGHVALAVHELYTPTLYLGYETRAEPLALAASALKAQVDSCEGRGVCLYRAPNACEFAKTASRAAPGGVDALLLLHTIYWMQDPAGELKCLRQLLKPGGKALVGQQVVESTPGMLAINVAFGARHVLSWRGVEQLLASAGYRLARRYLKYMPYYIAIWTR